VRNAANELGIEMEMRDIMENPAFRDELMSLAGKTQVPCLVIDGKPMHESDDIVSYLNEHYS
jgi:glutathione S-transferase